MAITRRFIQTRPNTDVEFYSPNEESMNKITEYVNLGKTSGVVTTVSEDNLTKTISITFDNINELDTFRDEITIINAGERAIAHCDSNSISFSIEEN